ncbi:hypothetical protein OCGS_0400 [Oceaniovalibus guishaninsula JLT2003]|uniref:HdeD protein n=1 Tax=Oceaniovalibus guishaninsula JLT2003 TaxID=1231392 RepID=K2I8D2_9RHOB|nr:DUF308 domain-containing protein [Oceaniovalibus guishaninsula]EKE45310.1 hypothetical protein OCGS_0400 [Oceaniovalibus guishaninsula JLT2003]
MAYNPQTTRDDIGMSRGWTIAMGVLLLIGGLLSFFNPFAASLTVQSLVAAFLLLAGIAQIWIAFRASDGSTGGRWVTGILGLLLILFAISLWVQPLAGLLSLTLVVAAFFLATGIVRIWIGFRMRHRRRWGWIVASGVVSVILALMIFFSLPLSALTILGIFFGVELTMAGVALIAVGMESP